MFSYKIDNKISLKLLEKNNAEELFELIDSTRSYLKEWLGWLDKMKELEDAQSFINDSRKQFAENNGFQAGIWYKEQLVGIIGLHEIDWEDKKTEIGSWLDQNHQGNGIVTKSCKHILNYCFDNLELNKVEIHCAEQNSKSRAVPERLGFTKEGVIREAQLLYDRFVNHVVYGMLRQEWEKCEKQTR